jgi:hypothetical protein
MSNTIQTRTKSFFDQHGQQDFSPLLSEIEKRDLAETGYNFDVLKIRQSETQKFGECWSLDIDLNGTVRGMMFSRGKPSDEQRDKFMFALSEEIRVNGPMTVRLVVTTAAKSGNDWYYLDEPDYDALESGNVPF